MSAFKGLLWKELKTSRADFYTLLGIMLFIFIVAASVSQYYGEPLIMAFMFIFVYIMHFGYLPLFLYLSLRREGKTQLWLHNPNKSTILLIAKLTASLAYYFLSLFIVFLGAYWSVEYAVIPALPDELAEHGLKGLLLIALFITAMAIYYAVWFQFYWTLFYAMKNNPVIKNIRWLIILVVWFAFYSVGNYLRAQPFFEKINHAGVIQIHILRDFRFEADKDIATLIPNMGTIDVSLITVLLYLLLTTIVFSLSAWLLERKVEV